MLTGEGKGGGPLKIWNQNMNYIIYLMVMQYIFLNKKLTFKKHFKKINDHRSKETYHILLF